AEVPFSRRALLAGGLLPFTLGGMDSERTVAEQLMARRAPMPRDVGIIDAVIDGRDHEYDKDGNRWNPGANKLYNDQRYYYKINPDPLPYISGGKYYYGASFKNSVLELPHGSSMKWIAEKLYYWSTSPIGDSDFRNNVPPSKISTPPLHMVARTGQDWNESITPSRPSPSNPASQIAPTSGWGTIFGEGDVYVSTWTDQYRVLNYDGWYKTIRLRFPVYQPVSLHVYSGALGYFDFPVRNGRYRIRSVGTEAKLGEERYLMLGGTGGNPNYVTNVRVPVTTWGPLAPSAMSNADWFVCSSSGTQYTMTPVQSLSCVLNNSYGKVDNAAQAFRLDWNDAADLMLIERLPNGNYTIRCKMTGAYLTANCLANSNGATCMFRSRRPGDTAQEWNLIPVDERYYTREQVRAALDSSSGQKPTFATTNSNHATNGNRIYCPTFTATKEHNKGVLSADKPGALPVGRDGIAVDRIQCDVGAYLLTQTAALPSHDMIDQRGVVGFQPYREFATRICLVNQPKGGKAPIHLMLL
ncbi:MAG: hypothetical protein Q4B30_08020, partial [Coriobacteriaceae bacterium]|nr:hypothetical protein [Coriobacteriaceae bacterium]